eukprot:scaffold102149_cov35-Tisochrysis_lutea.AAC.2
MVELSLCQPHHESDCTLPLESAEAVLPTSSTWRSLPTASLEPGSNEASYSREPCPGRSAAMSASRRCMIGLATSYTSRPIRLNACSSCGTSDGQRLQLVYGYAFRT